jgi:polysaccharide chain length determinant protein (PEP-CTERM system associated)
VNFPMAVETPGGGVQEVLSRLPTVWGELKRNALLLAIIFALIALLTLGIGVLWPKKFVSATTILVGEGNIIAPLMEGRAVATSVGDRARIASEVIFSRRLMEDVLTTGGWSASNPDALARERIGEEIKQRTLIDSPGENLIQISYHDSQPERAFKVAQRFADLFISESLAAKERESREAYEFIAARVDEYHAKLTEAEDKLKAFRAGNLDARPGTDVDVRERISQIRGRIETARTDLAEMQMRETSLQAQMSGEAEVSDVRSRASQTRLRLLELQNQLDTLLLDYTDSYPDVVRLRHQIDDLKAVLRREETAQANGTANDDAATSNPLYQQLRSDLAKVRSEMAALRARIGDNEGIMQEELERGRRVADSEAALAELTRDYEVNRDIYQDLLRRRENARVSMNLDAEQRGLSFRVQEPAALPLRASGLRLLHFAVAGVLGAIAVPLLILFLLVQFDPRARHAGQLAELSGLPVLVSIPEYQTRSDQRKQRLRLWMAAVIVLSALGVYFVLAFSRGALL